MAEPWLSERTYYRSDLDPVKMQLKFCFAHFLRYLLMFLHILRGWLGLFTLGLGQELLDAHSPKTGVVFSSTCSLYWFARNWLHV